VAYDVTHAREYERVGGTFQANNTYMIEHIYRIGFFSQINHDGLFSQINRDRLLACNQCNTTGCKIMLYFVVCDET
jgi:hypothetical protein